jgi:hypothetical protein
MLVGATGPVIDVSSFYYNQYIYKAELYPGTDRNYNTFIYPHGRKKAINSTDVRLQQFYASWPEAVALFAPTGSVDDGYQLKVYSKQDPRTELLDKPVLIPEGFDPGYNTPDRMMFPDLEQVCNSVYDLQGNLLRGEQGLLDYLYQNGYDIILMRYRNPCTDIHRNAETLLEAMKVIQSWSMKTDGHEMVIVAPSMGGLVTRLALQTAGRRADGQTYGQENGDHARLFIAFDSPNRGAFIPLSSQGFLSLASPVNEGAAISFKNLTGKAASQMLAETINMSNKETQTQFYSGLNNPEFIRDIKNVTNFGIAYPGQSPCPSTPIRTVAISNGSASGANLGLPSNFEYAATSNIVVANWGCIIRMHTMESLNDVNYFDGIISRYTSVRLKYTNNNISY